MKNDLRLIVCGGRDYADRARLFAVLDAIHRRNTIAVIIHGACAGADGLASDWADANWVTEDPYPVLLEEWRQFGKAAGPMRNRRMLEESHPDGVVAFPGGNGTKDMVRQAEAAGVIVMRVDW